MNGATTRERILEELRLQPGIHKSRLGRELGLSWGTVLHHVRVLERGGEVLCVSDGWQTHLYRAGDTSVTEQRIAWLAGVAKTPPTDQPRMSAERRQPLAMARGPQQNGEESREAILRLVEERPGIQKIELCRALGMSWNNTCYHVDVLHRSLGVRVHRYAGNIYLFPAKMPPGEYHRLSVIADETRMRLTVLVSEAVVSVNTLATAAGISARAVRRQISLLREAGVIELEGDLRLTEPAQRLLDRLKSPPMQESASVPA